MMNPEDMLVYVDKAQALIRRPTCWTKGTEARDIHNKSVPPTSDRAVCWCALGAMQVVLARNPSSDSMSMFRYLGKVAGKAVTVLNDEGTHANVMEFFNKVRAQLLEDATKNKELINRLNR